MSRILRGPHGGVWARVAILAVVIGGATAGLLSARAAGRRATVARPQSVFSLANRCVALKSVGSGRFIVAQTGTSTYAADAPTKASASRFFLKATGLGTYLLYDERAGLLSVGAHRTVGRAVPFLFNSAEAYLETWQRAYAHR